MSRRASAGTSSTSRPTRRRSRSVLARSCCATACSCAITTFVRTTHRPTWLVQTRAHGQPFAARPRRRHRGVRDPAAARRAGTGRRALRRRRAPRRRHRRRERQSARSVSDAARSRRPNGSSARSMRVVTSSSHRACTSCGPCTCGRASRSRSRPDRPCSPIATTRVRLAGAFPHETYADIETSDLRTRSWSADLERVADRRPGTIALDRTIRWGPKPIALRGCDDVRIEGITILGAPNYSVSLGACSDVVVDRVTIRDALSDGIDPDSCRRVRIVDCDVESDDDAICLKSSLFLGVPLPCEDIEVLRCRTRSGTNGFKIGTETSGPVRRVHVADCVFDARPRAGRDPRLADLHDLHEAGGISIQTVDGGDVEDIVIERVRIEHARGPISVQRARWAAGKSSRVPASWTTSSSATSTRPTCERHRRSRGVPGGRSNGSRLDHVRIEAIGGGTPMVDAVPVQKTRTRSARCSGGCRRGDCSRGTSTGLRMRGLQCTRSRPTTGDDRARRRRAGLSSMSGGRDTPFAGQGHQRRGSHRRHQHHNGIL